MLHIATEIRRLVHNIRDMETIGVKIASVEGSSKAQQTVVQASTGLYTVMVKCAEEYLPGDMPHHQRMTAFITKVASVLGLPAISKTTKLKLASAVVVDDALTDVMNQEKNPTEHAKLAEARAYGREFVMELLQGVL